MMDMQRFNDIISQLELFGSCIFDKMIPEEMDIYLTLLYEGFIVERNVSNDYIWAEIA